jgi:DNA polymerase-4
VPGEVRKIIHLDMDAFYASVEQRDDPTLRGRPVAVGGARDRGVVAAASYEARQFGVRSAMPSATARRLCPEPLSLDEAYLDVTQQLPPTATATQWAREIRARIKAETGLTASAGISYNKFLAKLASDYRKPDGQFVIRPHEGVGFVEQLKVGQFHGIGPATAARLNALGIFTGLDLRQQTEAFLRQHFGKAGGYYYAIARAEDQRPVVPDRVRKSIGSETTFAQSLTEPAEFYDSLTPLLASVWASAERLGVVGRSVTLKMKYDDFRQLTRSRTGLLPVRTLGQFTQVSHELLAPLLPPVQGVRLLGVALSGLEGTVVGVGQQLGLF